MARPTPALVLQVPIEPELCPYKELMLQLSTEPVQQLLAPRAATFPCAWVLQESPLSLNWSRIVTFICPCAVSGSEAAALTILCVTAFPCDWAAVILRAATNHWSCAAVVFGLCASVGPRSFPAMLQQSSDPLLLLLLIPELTPVPMLAALQCCTALCSAVSGSIFSPASRGFVFANNFLPRPQRDLVFITGFREASSLCPGPRPSAWQSQLCLCPGPKLSALGLHGLTGTWAPKAVCPGFWLFALFYFSQFLLPLCFWNFLLFCTWYLVFILAYLWPVSSS